MPSNLAIDDRLLEEARQLGHHRSKKDAVNVALAHYVARIKQLRITELFGTIEFDPDYDYKAGRSR